MEYSKDLETIERMKEMMWKFASNTKEYKLAQSTLAFLCERVRSKQKVELFYPPEIGSLEEKLQNYEIED